MEYQVIGQDYFRSERIDRLTHILTEFEGERPFVQVDEILRPIVRDIGAELGFSKLEPTEQNFVNDHCQTKKGFFSYIRDVHGIRPDYRREQTPDQLILTYNFFGASKMSLSLKLGNVPGSFLFYSFVARGDPSRAFEKYIDVPRPEDLCLRSRLYRKLKEITIEESLDVGPFVTMSSSNVVGVRFRENEIRDALKLFVDECKRAESIIEGLEKKEL